MASDRGSSKDLRFCWLLLSVLLVALTVRGAPSSWTKLTNLAPASPGTMMLLSDGTVMVQNNSDLAGWMRLKPDVHGSYIDGTWVQDIRPMTLARLYFASNVLSNGKVWVLGGEYSGRPLSQDITPEGEIWDPLANVWSPIRSYPSGFFGDDPSMLLPGGRILAGDIFSNRPQIYDIRTNTWSPAGSKVYDDRSDEESWAKLGNGNVVTYDVFQTVGTGKGYAEMYDPITNAWSSISPADGSARGVLPVLTSSALGFELGAILRLQDGRAFVIGANNHTALYDPSTNTWAEGPDTPSGFGADDAPAAEMPNGHIVYAADNISAGLFNAPTKIFEFNPVAETTVEITPAEDPNLSFLPSFVTRMLTLPTGQVLFADSSEQLWVYTGDGVPNPALRPVVNNVVQNGAGIFTLTGKRLNGQSAAAGYGDDAESDENYPLIRLTSSTGNVYYCRTSNWSTVGVDGSTALQTVNFTLNPAVIAGNYALTVVGAGIPSFPVFVNIKQNEVGSL
jgi:hypothetical protein